MKNAFRFGLALAIVISSAAFAQAQEKKQLVFVVNGASDFWKIAEAGVRKAQEEMPDFDMQLKYPEQAAAAIQQRLMDDLVAAGADAIVVSNHGGRLFDQTRATLEVLPEVIAAVGGTVPVILDGGVRNGGDIVKAIALGAKAALVGRPICWGVAVSGAIGVKRVIEILTEDVKRLLIMTGVGAVAQITDSIIVRA